MNIIDGKCGECKFNKVLMCINPNECRKNRILVNYNKEEKKLKRKIKMLSR